jgi:hypothetical protein
VSEEARIEPLGSCDFGIGCQTHEPLGYISSPLDYISSPKKRISAEKMSMDISFEGQISRAKYMCHRYPTIKSGKENLHKQKKLF